MTEKPSIATTEKLKETFNEALRIGVKNKNDELILSALKQGADPNVLLDLALNRTFWKKSFADMAVQHGANVNNLMFQAIKKQKLEFVVLAVERGAKLDWKLKNTNEPCFHVAYDHFNPKIIKYLLDKGADVDTKDQDGNTALMRAALSADWKKIKFYADHGANPTIVCQFDTTPLQKITSLVTKNEHAETLEKLMENISPVVQEPSAALTRDIHVEKPFSFKPPKT